VSILFICGSFVVSGRSKHDAHRLDDKPLALNVSLLSIYG
jgi:hypothetical protein